MNETPPAPVQVQVPGQGQLPVQIRMPPLSQGVAPAHSPGAGGLPAGQALQQTLDLRDIHPPASPEPWPPAPGWWLLLALVVVALAALGVRTWRALRARARRRRILAELTGLGAAARGAELAGAVSALLKRVALSRFQRAEVAPLTGLAWLDFLDRHGGAGRFAGGPGRVLAEGPYAPAPDLDPQALLDLAGAWVRRNA